MSWSRTGLFGPIFVALLLVGGVTDRALVEQRRLAEQAALSDLAERARLTAISVRDALVRIEARVLEGTPMPGVVVAQAPAGPGARLRWDTVPYEKRDRTALAQLLASRALTESGLPEAVVAAIALGGVDERTRVAERLASGLLPVRLEDLKHLGEVLGLGSDPRIAGLAARLGRAPDAATLPSSPQFRHALTAQGRLEGWSRTDTTLQHYEIPASMLVDRAGAGNRAGLVDSSAPGTGPGERVVPIPDVPELALTVVPDDSVGLRIRMLRVVLWMAVFASVVGLAAMVRAVGREARAIAREKAFLAAVTHELRTPLAAIRVFGETLAEGRGTPTEYGALVAQESVRLEALVEQVLAITRVDEAPAFAPVDPNTLIDSAVNLIAARADQRSVRIQRRAEDVRLPEADWDADAVRRALLNLLDNAVKHGKPGGRVELGALVDGDRIRLSVTDDGPGIGRRDRKRLFARFVRGSSESPGTGLGLYVVDQVARAHGGHVDLVSEEGQGCTFTLVLPMEPPSIRAPSLADSGAALSTSNEVVRDVRH